MQLSLKERLVRYLKNNHGWVSSGQLQKLVMEKTIYLPRTAVRRLEELAEEGILEVQYRAKNHAWYRLSQSKSFEDKVQEMNSWFNSLEPVTYAN